MAGVSEVNGALRADSDTFKMLGQALNTRSAPDQAQLQPDDHFWALIYQSIRRTSPK